ncbi:hypothetical protein FSP39_006754 [Pinctada imbricata]|uniref:RNase H type-1 domain-containing protein n=1 Tax=Pinctada imbricata TaxID=66713 RepID=A0AA89BNT4_PINIB|nr:hypothetical protein FSP39_006754 [Pinctada imbricata]
MTDELRSEIEHWDFLKNWDGFVSWRSEKHEHIFMASDASLFKFGAIILSGDKKGLAFGDFWDENDTRPIHLKEAEAVIKALQSVADHIGNHRVDLFTDNMSVIHAWENQGGKDPHLNRLMKTLFILTVDLNIKLNLFHVPSSLNEADTPSRSLHITDSMLSDFAWSYVQQLFGPHSVDLMSLDSNCMKDEFGLCLKHYTPYPTPKSAGVNVFAQDLSKEKNAYVFPPFQLIFPLLSCLEG